MDRLRSVNSNTMGKALAYSLFKLENINA